MGNSQTTGTVSRLDELIDNRIKLINLGRKHIRKQTETIRRGKELINAFQSYYEDHGMEGLNQVIVAGINWRNALAEHNWNHDDPVVQTAKAVSNESVDAVMESEWYEDNEEEVEKFLRDVPKLLNEYYTAIVHKQYHVDALERFERELREMENEVNTERIQIALNHRENNQSAGPGASSINAMLPKDMRQKLKAYLKHNVGGGRNLATRRKRTKRKRTKRKRKKIKRTRRR